VLKPQEYFLPLDMSGRLGEIGLMPSKTFARDTWERFCKNRRALFGLILLFVILLLAFLVPAVSPYPYDGMNTSVMNQGPSLSHLMGTDQFGRDEFTRVLCGARISLLIGFSATAINLFIGILIGGIAGYAGGALDMILMRIVDVIFSIPAMIYMILIMLILGSNVGAVILGICVSGWVNMARIVRSEVISLKAREFSTAAFVIGAGRWRILFKHLIINALGPIIVTATLMVPQAIFNEAFLSFIGIGISAPQASLGTLAQDAQMLMRVYPMRMVYPVAVICLVIFALNFIGEGLEEALNPKGGSR
jgi:oligopeptide transport system permease protein